MTDCSVSPAWTDLKTSRIFDCDYQFQPNAMTMAKMQDRVAAKMALSGYRIA